MAFSFEELSDDVRTAHARGGEAAVKTLLAETIRNAEAMQAATPADGDDEIQLFEDDTLSIWRCRFQPDVILPPHEHKLKVMIATYGGTEKSWLYERKDGQLVETGTITAAEGEIIELDKDAIHAVTGDGGKPSLAIHVYFGPLMALSRDLFDWETGAAVEFSMENLHAMQKPSDG
ncbi:MAG: hypothetical protein HKO95_09785 [Rhodobacteraceae bacterium]|nr:hypothetical protein [Paracoccaceae bacterium]